jgi:predicted dehydrogenase
LQAEKSPVCNLESLDSSFGLVPNYLPQQLVSIMTSLPMSIAIVGTGLIGPRHADAVHQDPDAKLSCIVDPNPASSVVAEKFNIPLYKSVKDMLASIHKPEAALVCTPNHTHVPISRELLEAGVHVLCEKPISTDVDSGRELVSCI